MKRILVLLISIICLAINGTAFSQALNQANVWYFGVGAGLSFSGAGSPAILTDGPDMSGTTDEGEAATTISDQNGNLLFFSDGDRVFDKNKNVMPNGSGMAGCFTSTQSALIVPQPGSVLMAGGYPRFYYLFTIDCVPPNGTGLGLRYSIIDMTLPGNGTAPAPLGDVVAASKNTLIQANVTEGMLAIPHFNGTDTWIVVRGQGTGNTYYAVPLSSAGIGSITTSTAGFIPEGTSTYIMKANPCFNMIAITYHNNWQTSSSSSQNCFEILRFNNNSGAVSSFATNLRITNVIQKANSADYRGIYGIEWSPSGRYLFVSELVDKQLYQYDVYAGAGAVFPTTPGTLANITASKQTLGVGSATRTGHVQLGPNGRIYTAQHVWLSGTSYVGEVANPEAFPATWNTTAYTFNNPVFVNMGLPTLSKSFSAGALAINGTTPCPGVASPFSYTFSGTAASQTWSSSPSAGVTFSASNTVASPNITFASAGTYTITVSVTDICGYTYTKSQSITVGAPAAPTGNVTCSSTQVTLNGTGAGSADYVWYDASPGQSVGVGTTVTLPAYSPLSSTPGTFYVKEYPATGSVVVAGHSSMANGWADAGHTSTGFILSQGVLFQSADVSLLGYGCCGSTMTSTIMQGATVIASVTSSCTGTGLQTITFNTYLPAGTYTLNTSCGGTMGYSGSIGSSRDVSGLINVTGSASGGVSGPFLNLTVKPVSACGSLVAINRTCTLPIVLLDFTGKRTAQGNLLSWTTVSERNARGFEVERSSDGVNYVYIGTVNAHGNSNVLRDYTFLDASIPESNVQYYRLKQVDFDGQYEYSSSIVITNSENTYSLIPNPGDGLVYLIGGGEEAVSVNVLDVQGRTVQSDIAAHSGSSLDLTGLSQGVYLVQVISPGSVQTLRYVLK